MRMLIFILLFSSIAISAVDKDGHITGNGGDVIVCKNKEDVVTSIELLDYYEGRFKAIRPSLGPADLSYEEKIKLAVRRLEKLSPVRAEKYQYYADKFLSETIFLTGQKLVDIPDSDNLAVPVGCTIEQIAIQRKPKFPEDRLYTINKDLWDLLDNDNKAGLVLHEIIYREAINLHKHKNSVSVRYLNAFLAADKFAEMNFKSFVELLVAAEFGMTDLDGIYLITEEIRFSEDGSLITARMQRIIQDQPVLAVNFVGKIDAGVFDATTTYFYADVMKLQAFTPTDSTYIFEDKNYAVYNKCLVRLYKDRHVKSLCLKESAIMIMADGSRQLIPQRHEIRFDSAGRVLSYDPAN